MLVSQFDVSYLFIIRSKLGGYMNIATMTLPIILVVSIAAIILTIRFIVKKYKK